MPQLTELWRLVKGWRTIGVSAMIAIAGVLQATDWTTVVAPDEVGPTLFVIGIVVALLRAVTDTPLGRK